MKNLGIHLDTNLDFKEQGHFLLKKIKKYAGF